MRNFRFSLALAAACAAATPVFAADAKLSWHDLDLDSAAGKAELDRRIEVAAQQLCAPQAVTGSRIAPPGPSAQCLADAREEIDAQVATRIAHGRPARARDGARTADAAR